MVESVTQEIGNIFQAVEKVQSLPLEGEPNGDQEKYDDFFEVWERRWKQKG